MYNININSAAKYLGVGFLKSSVKTEGEPYGESDIGKKKSWYTGKNSNKNSNENSGKRTGPSLVSSKISGKDAQNTEDSIDSLNQDIFEEDMGKKVNMGLDGFQTITVSRKKLQDAVIWSEIIGEPLCKRRKRR